MAKKIFIFIAIVLVAILLGLVYYYFTAPTTPGQSNGIFSFFTNLFPFGQNNPNTATTTPGGGTSTPTPIAPLVFDQRLRKISNKPVAGAGTLDIKVGTTTQTIVRHIEKDTGHIYETELFSPNQNRISNTTIPVVYDAVWGNKNMSLVARYLEDDNQTVDTYSLVLKNISTTTENTIYGIAFPKNISDVSTNGNTVFYLEKLAASSLGFTSTFDGKNRKQIWSSPIRELNSQFVNAKTVALTTKPEENISGYMYFVDTGTGAVKRVLGDVPGLSTLVSPDGTQVLYISQSGNAYMYLYSQSDKSNVPISPVTFPEKCVWSIKQKSVAYCAVPRESLGSSSLSSWYKGTVSFTDDIWKFDFKNNSISQIENLLDDAGESIDVIKPILSENERYFVFMNKRDNILWSLDLSK